MTLTDLAIKRARPAQKIIKLSDGGGLQWWRRAALTRPLAKLGTATGDVFRYAIATVRAENDSTSVLRGALVTPTVTPRAAIATPNAFGGSLQSIEDYQALRLFFCAGTNDISRTASGWQPRTTAWGVGDIRALIDRVKGPMARRFNYRRVKIHRNHPVAELADVIGAHKQTISRWIAARLPTTDRKRRHLIRGVDIHAFMQERGLERDVVSLDWFGGRARGKAL